MAFHKQYLTPDNFPLLLKHAKMMPCLFGSTHICEQLFSLLKIAKNKKRTYLKDQQLEGTLRIASCTMEPNMDRLVANMRLKVSSLSN